MNLESDAAEVLIRLQRRAEGHSVRKKDVM